MPVHVSIGGATYTLKPLPRKQAKAWRQLVQTTLDPVITTLDQVLRLDTGQGMDIPVLLSVIKDQVLPVILSYPDMAWDLLCAYSPEIAAHADTLEDHATDEDVLDAFVEALQQAYPLGQKARKILGRFTGLTSMNSPMPSGPA